MRVAIIMKFNKLAYHDAYTFEESIINAKKMLENIKKEKEAGILLDVYGLPGEDSTMRIYEVDSLEALDDLFTNEHDRFLTYEVHYLTDFEKSMEAKLEKWTR